MEESRVFSLNGVSLETVVKSVETFLRDEKGMEIQSAPVEHGCVIQATQKKDTLKMLVGMRLATTVQLVVSGENLNVMIGEGQWADKIGAGALGLFIAWPLAITAGMGAFKQKKLPDEIFRTVENCIISGGRSAVYGGAEHSAHTAAETMSCPKCGAQLPVGSKFCNQCGEKLGNVCPSCGTEVVQGSMFCSNCGQKLQ